MLGILRPLVLTLCCGLASTSMAAEPNRADPDDSDSPAGDSGHRVAILPVRVTGDMGPVAAEKLRARLIEELSQGDFELLTPEQVKAKAAGPFECKDAECYKSLGKELGAEHLVSAEIGLDGRDYVIKVTLIETASGAEESRSEETCDICGLEEAGEVIQDEAQAVRTKLADLVRSPPILVIESTPPGALVTVDGKVVGVTPFREPVNAGKHSVVLSLAGHIDKDRDFLAVQGVEESLRLELDPMPQDTGAKRNKLWPAGWGLFAVGLVATGVGAGVWAIDNSNPKGAVCTGDNVDVNNQCKFRYNTLAAGATTTSIGAVSIIVGVALVIAGRDKGSTGKKGADKLGWLQAFGPGVKF